MAVILTFSISTGVGLGSKGTLVWQPQLLSLPFNLLSRGCARGTLAHLTQERSVGGVLSGAGSRLLTLGQNRWDVGLVWEN